MHVLRYLTEEERVLFRTFGNLQVDDTCQINGQEFVCIERFLCLLSQIQLKFALSKKGYQYYYAINYSLDGLTMFSGKLWTIKENDVSEIQSPE